MGIATLYLWNSLLYNCCDIRAEVATIYVWGNEKITLVEFIVIYVGNVLEKLAKKREICQFGGKYDRKTEF